MSGFSRALPTSVPEVTRTTMPLAICLMGPTAIGKTALALVLAEQLPVEIVSVDASQVYRNMDIGTAKPTLQERSRVPHHLVDIRDPAECYSAAEFRIDALREMESITRQGKIPLLVGGTMFYFHVLEFGLSALPAADPKLRARLREEAERLGWPALHARLARADPQTAARLHPHDAQRIQRALEILTLTGQPPSRLTCGSRTPPPYRFLKLALIPEDRARLHRRIAQRFREMLEQGLIEEVKILYRRGDLSLAQPAMRTVNYRQVWEYLTGKINYNEMIDAAIAATRQLAKRQLTWLRRYPGLHRIEVREHLPIQACQAYLREIPIHS